MGGLWILWKNSIEFKLQILEQNNMYVHCIIKDGYNKSSWLADLHLWLSTSPLSEAVMGTY